MWEYSREIEIERVTGSWREKQKVSLGMCALAQREREAENPSQAHPSKEALIGQPPETIELLSWV